LGTNLLTERYFTILDPAFEAAIDQATNQEDLAMKLAKVCGFLLDCLLYPRIWWLKEGFGGRGYDYFANSNVKPEPLNL
jgi:hypothetical protein